MLLALLDELVARPDGTLDGTTAGEAIGPPHLPDGLPRTAPDSSLLSLADPYLLAATAVSLIRPSDLYWTNFRDFM